MLAIGLCGSLLFGGTATAGRGVGDHVASPLKRVYRVRFATVCSNRTGAVIVRRERACTPELQREQLAPSVNAHLTGVDDPF